MQEKCLFTLKLWRFTVQGSGTALFQASGEADDVQGCLLVTQEETQIQITYSSYAYQPIMIL